MKYPFSLPPPEKLNIKLYSPEGEYILNINTTIELFDIRCQIKDYYLTNHPQKPGGFYLMDNNNNNNKVLISNRGLLHGELPCNFENYLDKLMWG